MRTVSLRHQAALGAVRAVLAGVMADDAETETVDFKEEADTNVRGTRHPIDSKHEPAAQALANEVACFANTTCGGVLVVGVADDRSGPDALIGSYLDLDWLKERIWALTTPHYSGFFIEEVTAFGPRLYFINVEPALEEIRAGDKLRTRHGKRCVELTGDTARRFLEARRGFDWSAEPSGMRLSEADPKAIETAMRFYRQRGDTAPPSGRELASRMGVLLDDGDDPGLNRAGALLLAPFEPRVVQAQLLITDVEGRPARNDLVGRAPLVLFLEEADRLLDDVAFPVTPVVVGLTRRELRLVPRPAYREALVNAVMHRDYRLDRQPIYALASGSPADSFKVRSPGGLLPVVSVDRLLATPSRPRNEALAHALWAIAVAERQGVGIKTMYRTMLREGHDAPEIVEDNGELVVRLAGGTPDVGLRAFFDDIEAQNRAFEGDPAAVIAIRELLHDTPLRPERLAVAAQRTVGEAFKTLTALEAAGAVERLLNGSRSFRLTSDAKSRLGERVTYRRSTIDEHASLIRAYLDRQADISREQAVRLLGVEPRTAGRVLGKMLDGGDLEYSGPSRGRNVRYRLPRA
jgi:ATP-dependent DNA helicase RecG